MDNEEEAEELPSVDEAVDRWRKATDRIKCDEDGTLQDEEAAVEDVVEIVISGSILVDLLRSLVADAARLTEWKAGAIGALTILHPPRTHGHTESAYLSHKARYEAGMAIPGDPYCDAADFVAANFVAVQAEADRAAAIRAFPAPEVLTEYVQAIEAAAVVDDRVGKVLAAHTRATRARQAYKDAVR